MRELYVSLVGPAPRPSKVYQDPDRETSPNSHLCHRDQKTFSDVTTSRSLHLQTDLATRPTARDAYEYFNSIGDTGTPVLNFSTKYMYELYYSRFPHV
jgi:hypothetical protein